jgi:Flp pilus assembly protein TadG
MCRRRSFPPKGRESRNIGQLIPMRERATAHTRTAASVSKKLRPFGADARGVAGIEFGITGLLLVVGLLNAVDVGYYAYKRMEVENAAEVGGQAAWKTCNNLTTTMLPATVNCPTLNATITTAIQSTTLGTAVSLASGYPAENYYCVNASNALILQGPVSSPPTTCSTGIAPGDYIQVQVTYPYQALFAFSVMSALKVTSITKTSWMRMG